MKNLSTLSGGKASGFLKNQFCTQIKFLIFLIPQPLQIEMLRRKKVVTDLITTFFKSLIGVTDHVNS